MVDHATGKAEACRLVARSVLFGRVPRNAVMWLGMGVMLASLVVGVLCMASFDKDYSPDFHRDAQSSVMIRR